MKRQKNTLGSGPVEERYVAKMEAIARVVDQFLNPLPIEKQTGFILMVFPLGDQTEGRTNYMSNARREDVVRLLKEQIRYFEGAPDNVTGRA